MPGGRVGQEESHPAHSFCSSCDGIRVARGMKAPKGRPALVAQAWNSAQQRDTPIRCVTARLKVMGELAGEKWLTKIKMACDPDHNLDRDSPYTCGCNEWLKAPWQDSDNKRPFE